MPGGNVTKPISIFATRARSVALSGVGSRVAGRGGVAVLYA